MARDSNERSSFARRGGRRAGRSAGKSGMRIGVAGTDELLTKLKKFPDRLQRKVLRPAVMKAATPIAKKARKLAPVGEGLTPAGESRPHLGQTIIRTRARFNKKTGNVYSVVGPEKGKAPHSHLVHDGTKPHAITLTEPLTLGRVTLPAGFVIRHPGAKAQPFITDAATLTASKSAGIMRTAVAAGIEKIAKLP